MVLALTAITTMVVEEVVLPVIQAMVVVVLTTTQVHSQGKTLMVPEAAVAVVRKEPALQVQELVVVWAIWVKDPTVLLATLVAVDRVELLERIQADLLAVEELVPVAHLMRLEVLALQVVSVFCGALEDLSRQQTWVAQLTKLSAAGFI